MSRATLTGRGSIWGPDGSGRDFSQEEEARFQAQAREDAIMLQQAIFLAEPEKSTPDLAKPKTVPNNAQAGIGTYFSSCCVAVRASDGAGEAPATLQY